MDFIKIIDDAIANIPDEEPRRYIGASGIGNDCSLRIWNDYNCVPSKPITPKLRRTFDIGKRLEDMMLDYIEQAGFKLIRPQPGSKGIPCQDDEFPEFQGHMDALLFLTETNVVVLELKTANNAEYKKFVENGLKSWKPVYFSQVMSYMGMKKLKNAVIIVMNKDTSEWACEWIEFDEIMYSELRVKAINIAHAEEPPEKINNNPSWYMCQMCKYKEVCHKPSEVNVVTLSA